MTTDVAVAIARKPEEFPVMAVRMALLCLANAVSPEVADRSPEVACCPFCGSRDTNPLEDIIADYQICCSDCSAVGPSAATVEEAMERWNSCFYRSVVRP